MSEKVRIVIADDHEVYRDGLRSLLQKAADLEVVGEASHGKELIEICTAMLPDVVLTDIMMPLMDGVEATNWLAAHQPQIKIIALSMSNQDNLIIEMMNAGAMGYLIKNANKHEIIEAIHSVNKMVPYYCRTTSMKLARMIGSSHAALKQKEKVTFSDKEIAIIKLVCQEKTSKQIGDELFISSRTVEEYRERIREKMNVKTSMGIVIYAIKHKLVEL